MRFRNSRLRTKITALLVSLIALWCFAAWVTLREGVNLLWVSTVNTGVAQPIDKLQPELQQERKLSLILLGSPGPQQRAALAAQRSKTDAAIAKFKSQARGQAVKLAQSDALKTAIDNGFTKFDAVVAARASVDSGVVNRDQAATVYDQAVDAIFQMDDSLATLDDKGFARSVQTLVQLNKAREILSQEDALMSGVIASRRMTATDYSEFVQTVGAQRYELNIVMESLPTADGQSYDLISKSDVLTRLRAVEDQVVAHVRVDRTPPVTSAQWQSVADPALSQLSDAVFQGGDRMINKATPIAIGVIIRLALAGGLGLLAVVASVIVSISTLRNLMAQLEKLRGAAKELAEERLPNVVDRLGHGEQVDIAAEAPPLSFGADEVGQVGRAFNQVQETAIRTAVEQAELRRSFRDMLLSLARRSQALVHRQLNLLDTMERREQDVTELEDLFRIDHLATRMRRNAENLIVLSGSTPARGWRRPVPMMDVVRSAVAEVEDYTRVAVAPMTEVALVGRAVGDIAHLLAELIENAVSFSPPYTQAQVSGHMVASGYAIEIEDRGLGMTDENLVLVNQRITDPPEFNLASSQQLGLYVVGRLAERYDVRVALKHSAYGGTTAVVLIPRDLIVEDADIEPGPVPATASVGGPVGGTASGPVPLQAVPDRAIPAPPQPQRPVQTTPARPGGPAPLPIRQSPNGTPAQTPLGAPVAMSPPSEPYREPSIDVPDNPQESSVTHTPSGLPFRVPQANLAPALREERPPAPEPEPEDEASRTPDEVRRIVGAFQRGTRQGRSDAARAADDQQPSDGSED